MWVETATVLNWTQTNLQKEKPGTGKANGAKLTMKFVDAHDVLELRELKAQPSARRIAVLKKVKTLYSRASCYISLKRWGRDDGISQALYDDHFYGQWTRNAFEVLEMVNCISWHMLADDESSVRIAAAVSDT